MGKVVSRDSIFRPFAFPIPKVSYDRELQGLMFIEGTGDCKNPQDRDSEAYTSIPIVYYRGYPDSVPCKDRVLIIYSHGTATDIGYSFKTVKHLSEELKVDVINYEYPGFGLFKGIPCERSCYDTVLDVYDYAISLGYSLDNLILYGMSMGTAMTIYLAKKLSDNGKMVKAVVLQAPFKSGISVLSTQVANIISSIYSNPESPGDMFLNYKYISSVKSPIIIIHGDSDKIVPISHGIEIASKAATLKAFIRIKGGKHTNLRENHTNEWISAFKHALSD